MRTNAWLMFVSIMMASGLLLYRGDGEARPVSDSDLDTVLGGADCYYPQPLLVPPYDKCDECMYVSGATWKACAEQTVLACEYLAGMTYNGDCIAQVLPCPGQFWYYDDDTCSGYPLQESGDCSVREYRHDTIGGYSWYVNCPP